MPLGVRDIIYLILYKRNNYIFRRHIYLIDTAYSDLNQGVKDIALKCLQVDPEVLLDVVTLSALLYSQYRAEQESSRNSSSPENGLTV